jgi:hypothetical protein
MSTGNKCLKDTKLHTLQTCSNFVDSNFATTSPPLSLLPVAYGDLVLLVSTVSFLFLIFVYSYFIVVVFFLNMLTGLAM